MKRPSTCITDALEHVLRAEESALAQVRFYQERQPNTVTCLTYTSGMQKLLSAHKLLQEANTYFAIAQKEASAYASDGTQKL